MHPTVLEKLQISAYTEKNWANIIKVLNICLLFSFYGKLAVEGFSVHSLHSFLTYFAVVCLL